MRKSLVAIAPICGVLAASVFAANVALAADPAPLNFDFKINQGPVGTTFATLSLQELTPGTTTFTLNTNLSGGQGNPGIVELLFGCNSCGTATFSTGPGVTVGSGGTQAGYNFDFRATFDPRAVDGNTPLTFTASGAPASFLEATSGAGPSAFALIQLTGGMQVLSGVNVESGFYVAAVPEPSTYALMFTGLGLVGFAIQRRRKQVSKHRII